MEGGARMSVGGHVAGQGERAVRRGERVRACGWGGRWVGLGGKRGEVLVGGNGVCCVWTVWV